MKSIQANMRLFGLPSNTLGKDWTDISTLIDLELEKYQFELDDQKVYLVSETSAASLLEHEGKVMVFRSVIGAKQNVEEPFELMDWDQKSVFKYKILGRDWEQILLEIHKVWENLTREGRKLRPGFWLIAERRLSGGLELTTEVMFHE